MRCVLALILMLAALPAAAQSLCAPASGQSHVVSGVPARDSLDLLSRPRDGRVVGAVAGGSGVTTTGRVRFTNDQCALACNRIVGAAMALQAEIEADCLRRGRIWYEVRAGSRLTGWVAAQQLTPGRPSRPPADAAAADGAYRFVCRNGDRITVTVRSSGREAEVVTRDGLFFTLARVAGGAPFNYRASGGGISLSGTTASVTWAAPRTRETECVERP